MTSENWVVQVSVKLPHDQNDNYRDTLVNVRAETTEQLASTVGWLQNNAAELAASIQAIRAAATVGTVFTGPGTQTVAVTTEPQAQVVQGPWGQPQQAPPQWSQQGTQQYQQPQQQAQAPAGPGPMCAHGPMQWKEGIGKQSGKPYKGWFCTSKNRDQQCDTQWVR